MCQGYGCWTTDTAAAPQASIPGRVRSAGFGHMTGMAHRCAVTGGVASTMVGACVTDLSSYMAGDLGRIVLVRDCMSAVSGFEAQEAQFFVDMAARGMQICTAAEMAAELKANA